MSKTLDTVEVILRPEDAMKVMRGRELRTDKEGWSLVATKVTAQGAIVFSLWVDGSETGESVTLHTNGTWTATTHVVLGDML